MGIFHGIIFELVLLVLVVVRGRTLNVSNIFNSELNVLKAGTWINYVASS